MRIDQFETGSIHLALLVEETHAFQERRQNGQISSCNFCTMLSIPAPYFFFENLQKMRNSIPLMHTFLCKKIEEDFFVARRLFGFTEERDPKFEGILFQARASASNPHGDL